jgi:hypothetical protein
VIHVVDVDADRGLERIAEIDLIEPAQADRVVRPEVARVAPEIRIRDREADVLDVLDAAELELFARERRDRDRRRLDVLRDSAPRRGFRPGVLSVRWNGDAGAAYCARERCEANDKRRGDMPQSE